MMEINTLTKIDKKDNLVISKPHTAINLRIRKVILLIEAKINSMPESLGEDPFPLKHSFAEGLYIREIIIPKGAFIVGKLHKDSYVNFVTKGELSVLSEEGAKRVKAPCTIISPPGTKRFGYTHTETVWTTVHANPNNETDIEILEKMIHTKEYPVIINIDEECPELINFVDEITKTDKKLFNVYKFRGLTKEIYSHEKDGFWSDWSKEQQEIYMSGDWEAFSESRGYTQEEIDNVRLWIEIKESAEESGLNPLEEIRDLSIAQAIKNMEKDVNREILLSSHIPSSKKVPYKITRRL